MTSRYVTMYWSMDIARFGQDIAAARMTHKLKMHELAALVDVSQSNISRIERGEAHNPEVNTVLKICDALDLDPRTYFEVRKLGE